MKSVAVASLFLSIALAQTTKPLIDGTSPSCDAFLKNLDSTKPLQACTDGIISATAAFASGQGATSAAITTAFTSLCSTPTGSACGETSVRTILTAFYTECAAELTTARINDVVDIYDTLYNLLPLRSAICAKTATGAPCIAALTSVHGDSPTTRTTQSGQNLDTLQQHLYKTENGQHVVDAGSISSSGLPFLFMAPGMTVNDLCTTCNREILNAYLTFESDVPYAPGIGASPLLAGQVNLLNAVTQTCSAAFLAGAVDGASGLSGGTINVGSGASRISGEGVGSIVALAAVFVGIVASL